MKNKYKGVRLKQDVYDFVEEKGPIGLTFSNKLCFLLGLEYEKRKSFKKDTSKYPFPKMKVGDVVTIDHCAMGWDVEKLDNARRMYKYRNNWKGFDLEVVSDCVVIITRTA